MGFKKTFILLMLLLSCYNFSYATNLSRELAEDSYEEALALHRAAKIEEAKSAYQKALMLGLASKEYKKRALNNLGAILAKEGDLEGAQDLFKQSLSLDPDYKTAKLNLGILNAMHLSRNDLIKSSLTAINASKSEPRYFLKPQGADESFLEGCLSQLCRKTLFNIQGVKYAQAQDWDKAGEAFKEALAIDPDYKMAGLNLALVYEKKKGRQVDLDSWIKMLDVNLEAIKEQDFIFEEK